MPLWQCTRYQGVICSHALLIHWSCYLSVISTSASEQEPGSSKSYSPEVSSGVGSTLQSSSRTFNGFLFNGKDKISLWSVFLFFFYLCVCVYVCHMFIYAICHQLHAPFWIFPVSMAFNQPLGSCLCLCTWSLNLSLYCIAQSWSSGHSPLLSSMPVSLINLPALEDAGSPDSDYPVWL